MRIMEPVLAAGMVLLLASSASARWERYEVGTDVVSHEMTQDIHVWYPIDVEWAAD